MPYGSLACAGGPGGPDGDGGALLARGRGEVHGVPAAWTRSCDAAGRVIDTVEGALGHAAGFDGERGWRIDETGMPGPLELGDLDELLAAAAVWRGTRCREDGPLAIDDAISLDGALVRLAARARGGHRRFRIIVDSRTWHAARLERAGRDDAAHVFDDYRPTPWGLVPHLLVRREAHLADTVRLESVAQRAGPSATGSPGRPPMTPPSSPARPHPRTAGRATGCPWSALSSTARMPAGSRSTPARAPRRSRPRSRRGCSSPSSAAASSGRRTARAARPTAGPARSRSASPRSAGRCSSSWI